MSHRIADLRAASDEELIAAHDELAAHTVPGVNYYLEELARREVGRRERRMERLTVVILVLTVANVAAVIAGAAL